MACHYCTFVLSYNDSHSTNVTNTNRWSFQTGVEELNQFSGTTAKFLFDICPELGKQMADTFIPSDGEYCHT